MNHLATERKLEILINTNTYTQIIIIIKKKETPQIPTIPVIMLNS